MPDRIRFHLDEHVSNAVAEGRDRCIVVFGLLGVVGSFLAIELAKRAEMT